jgi:hypothetical protein
MNKCNCWVNHEGDKHFCKLHGEVIHEPPTQEPKPLPKNLDEWITQGDEMTEKKELMPCPFCGYKAFLCDDGNVFAKYFVGCMRCNCRTIKYDNAFSARKIWNTRQQSTELKEAVELLRFIKEGLDDYWDLQNDGSEKINNFLSKQEKS